MKKYFMIALAAISLSLTSCKKDVEAQAHDYAEQIVDAMMKGDQEEMMKLSNQSEEWLNSLSAEDKAKAEAVFEEEGRKAAEKMMKELGMNAGAVDSLATATKDAAAELESAVDDAADAVEDAADEVDNTTDE